MVARKHVVLLGVGGEQGTGFLIAPDKLVTALHVVTKLDDEGRVISDGTGQPEPLGRIHCTYYLPERGHWEEIVEFDPTRDPLSVRDDYVILTVAQAGGVRVWGCANAQENDRATRCSTYGFPASRGSEGAPLHGTLTGISDPHTVSSTASVLQTTVPIHRARFPEATGPEGYTPTGFSGAPLVLDDHVVGFVRSFFPSVAKEGEEDEDEEREEKALGATFNCTPIEAVLTAAGMEALVRRSDFIPFLGDRVHHALREYRGEEELTSLRDRLYRRPLESEFHRLRFHAGLTLVVGDAGQGKTTWSAATALNQARISPVVWFPATAIPPTGLDTAIIKAVWGSNDSKSGDLVRLLQRVRQVLLVFIDAIDEFGDYERLLRLVRDFKAQHVLAHHCHLVLTCRTEAVRTFEEIDSGLLPSAKSDGRSRRLYLDPLRERESERLLQRNGATPNDIAELKNVLPHEFFGNPLYLTLARKLQRDGTLPRHDARWVGKFAEHFVGDIHKRLRGQRKRPSRRAIHHALGHLAHAAIQDPRGADPEDVEDPLITPDEEGEGTFLERASQSSLLVRNGERFRFCHPLLCEHFTAHHIITNRDKTTNEKIDTIARLPGRISLARFAAEAEPTLFIALARQRPGLLPPFKRDDIDEATQEALIAEAARLLESDFPSERSAAIRILGTFRTSRSVEAAVNWFNALDQSQKITMLHDAAELFLQLEHLGALRLVSHHRHFSWPVDMAWYTPEFGHTIEKLSTSFKARFADYAFDALAQVTLDTADRARLTMILTYLRDPRLLVHLQTKSKTSALASFEHRALIYMNTDKANQVYLSSREYYYKSLDSIDTKKDSNGSIRSRVWDNLIINLANIRRFPHDALIRLAKAELQSQSRRDQRFGINLAGRVRCQDPDFVDAYASVTRGVLPDDMIDNLVKAMDTDSIIRLYHEVKTIQAKKDILRSAGTLPNRSIEDLMLEALDDRNLFGAACIGLMELGCDRAGPRLLEALTDVTDNYLYLTIKALGRIQYVPALGALLELLDNPTLDQEIKTTLVEAVGLIGGTRAYRALAEYYQAHPNMEVIMVLIDSPDESAQRTLHNILDVHPQAKRVLGWAISLRDQLHNDTTHFRDLTKSRTEFSDDKTLDALLECAQEKLTDPPGEHELGFRYDYEAIALFDSPKATLFFEELARRDPSSDPTEYVRDAVQFARRLLTHRGDRTWARAVVDQELDHIGSFRRSSDRDADPLMRWPADVVREALLERVRDAPEKWLQLFARFADKDDETLIRESLERVRPELADVIMQRLPSQASEPS